MKNFVKIAAVSALLAAPLPAVAATGNVQFDATVNNTCCGGEKVHQPRSDASMAARSMAFSPITTRRVSRAVSFGQGWSK